MGGLSKEQIWQLGQYGEMGFGGQNQTINVTQNAWAVVTNNTSDLWAVGAGQLNGITYSNDSLVIGEDGKYKCNVQLSLDGSNGSIIRLGVYVNGSLACLCTGYQELTNNQIVQLSYVDIFMLSANDVIQVVITDTTGNSTPAAIAGKIALHRVG